VIELLAPAGDLEKLNIAYFYGADACYIGGTILSLRSRASNFDEEDLAKAVDLAHNIYHKKLYVTINIIIEDIDEKVVIDYLRYLDKIGIDAVIVSSIHLISLIKKYTKLEIHLSTQISTSNLETIKYYQNLGVNRVVLARELTYLDLKEIKENTKAELEIFIHGAMCSSFSGRCSLSKILCGRDANLGNCAHSCRWRYSLYDSKKNLITDSFSIASKDLNTIKFIPKILQLNISSLKIEGRMKSLYYIALVTRTYRNIIDDYYNNKKIDYKNYQNELINAENRATWSGYLFNKPDENSTIYEFNSEIPNQIFLGIVKEHNDKYLIIQQRNYFTTSSLIDIITPNKIYKRLKIKQIYDENNNIIDAANHPMQVIKIRLNTKRIMNIPPYSLIRSSNV